MLASRRPTQKLFKLSALHNEDVPSTWEHLCQLDDVSAALSFSDYVSTDADAVTTEVLGDESIFKLITSAEEEAQEEAKEDADDIDAAKDLVLTPSQVMDALDLPEAVCWCS